MKTFRLKTQPVPQRNRRAYNGAAPIMQGADAQPVAAPPPFFRRRRNGEDGGKVKGAGAAIPSSAPHHRFAQESLASSADPR